MNLTGLSGFWRLILFFLPFLLVQRWFHRELQFLLYRVTKKTKYVVVIYSILFFPGVLVHEGSHFLAAKLLGVRTGKFSIAASKQPNGMIRMGYVETEKVDFIRNSLIGAAPLFTAGLLISLLGVHVLKINSILDFLLQGELAAFWVSIQQSFSRPAFWITLYITVTLSSMMLPSSADRQDWMVTLIFLCLLLGLFSLAGAWGWLRDFVLPWLDRMFAAASMVFAFSLAAYLVILLPFWVVSVLINKITHLTKVSP